MAKIAEYVNLISLTQLTGDFILINRLSQAKNITVLTQHETKKIEGQNFVQSILIKNLLTGEEKKLAAGGIFVEIGLVPNSEAISHLVRLNKLGEVPVSCMCETTMSGLYAAGDVTDIPEKQIIIAAGEGAKAALQVHRYLQQSEE
jgi:alkyl hydroperoxide reductase subunit F